jgi:hypothetical protein
LFFVFPPFSRDQVEEREEVGGGEKDGCQKNEENAAACG